MNQIMKQMSVMSCWVFCYDNLGMEHYKSDSDLLTVLIEKLNMLYHIFVLFTDGRFHEHEWRSEKALLS